MALISVIVPVYNVSKYLERCVDSLIMQTFRKYEVILIDDGSTDGGGALCDSYAQQYEYVHALHQDNNGLSAARNAGITWAMEHSDSQYISFVDSDDWVHPRYLEWLYGAIKRGSGTVAIGKYIKVSDDCAFEDDALITTVTPTWLYCNNVGNFIVAWGKLFSKGDFRDIRFPLGKLHEDEFTIWKILFRYNEIAFVHTPIYAYFQRTDSIIGTWSPDRLVCIDAMKEQLDWIAKNGNAEMLTKVKQRIAVAYAESTKAMTRYGMPAQTIHEYRKELRRHIRSIRK